MASKFGRLRLIILTQGLLHFISLTLGTSLTISRTTYTYRYCEHSGRFSLQCNGGKFINVTNAMYGRLSTEYCRTATSATNCKSPLSMQVVARWCHGLTSCTVEATNSAFGDPCKGILKYLEISYTCLNGNEFPSLARIPDGYVYSSQIPHQYILKLQPNSTNLKVAPFRFRIFNITETNYDPKMLDSVYPSAIDFLSSRVKTAPPAQKLCSPNIGGYGSKFCVFEEYGYIFTSNTFIPGMFLGKSYSVDLVVRDYSPVPYVGKARVKISVVQHCFPMQQLYNQMRSRCPSKYFKFTFPTNMAWSHSAYSTQFPIAVTSPITISRIFIDIDLLIDFKRDSSYWNYEIDFATSKGVLVRNFVYVPSTLDLKVGRVIQARGTKLNMTIDPPIELAAAERIVNVSISLVENSFRTAIKFNSQNAVNLYGTQKISICPDSFCMNAYRPWQKAVEKLKYTQNFECITDEGLQEIYLKPCDSDPCLRSFSVLLTAPGGSIIYNFQEHQTFKRFKPTFYRVILYEYDGESFPGYSSKYFCAPQPFDDARRFICLNRYAGRFRIRPSSASNFSQLAERSVFSIEVQAEATINGTLLYDRCVFDLWLTATLPSTTIATTTESIATTTESIATTTASTTTTKTKTNTTAATKSTTPYSKDSPTPTASTTTNPSGRPAINESLTVILSKSLSLAHSLNITCLRSTSYVTTVRWYKDGILLTQTGTSLIINTPAPNDQGHYQCSVDLMGIRVFSDKKLVTFKDVFTTSTYLEIVNRKFTVGLNDASSAEYKTLSEEIILVTRNAIKGLPTTGIHDIKVEKFSKGSVIAQVQIASPVNGAQSMTSYYNTLTNLFVTAANQNNFGDFQIPATGIIIVNKENCLSQTTNTDSSKGPYTWPVTRSGDIANVPCANGPPMANATRKCIGDFAGGSFWGSIVDGVCNFNSKRTNELNSLSERPINATNAESVATELGTLTQNATSLTTDDTLLASKTFKNLASSNITSDKVVNDMLQIASNLLQTNESTLASSQAQGNALTSIVKGIEQIADSIQLPNKTGEAVVKVSSGVAIQAMKLDTSSSGSLNFGLKTSSISLNNIVSNEVFQPNQVEIGLQLPSTLLRDVNMQGEQRLSFVVYGGNQFFQTTKKNVLGQRVIDFSSKPNSKVISAHIKGIGKVSLRQPLQGTFKKILPSSKDSCVFWDFSLNEGYGGWSSDGCRKTETNADRVICQCDHMTNFAIIFDPYAGTVQAESATHEQILGIISYIGIGISLAGLFLTLLTLFLFRRLRRSLPPKILIHLCLSLMLTLLCFVAGADRTESLPMCRAFAILIQYFMLATFFWMSVEALNLYMSFVVVMGSYITRFILKAAIYAWGLPAVIVAVTASSRISDYGNERNCVISGWAAYGSLFIPVCIILVINFAVLIKVFYALRSSAKGKKVTKDQKRSGMSQLRIAATFSCILGLTWVFGVFAVGDGRLAFQYLFCIFNSLQGFVIFYLHVARHTDARNHWIHFLTGKGLNYHRATISSSSHLKTFKQTKSDTYRMRAPTSEVSNGTLTSTLGGKSTISSTTELGSSFA